MTVKKMFEIDVELEELGDIICFALTTGEQVEAMAIKEIPEGILFITRDCVGREMPMFDDIEEVERNPEDICYQNSGLRRYLNSELLDMFPGHIRERMIPMQVGDEKDLLRIPTEKELFGENWQGFDEEGTEQFACMKDRRNRIAYEHSDGKFEWQIYWLQNKRKYSAAHFANVNSNGYAYYDSAGNSNGVRPCFLLSYDPAPQGSGSNEEPQQ